MKKVIALGGSNSKFSINKKFANYTANQLDNAEIVEVDLYELDLPMFSIDLENDEGIPKKIKELDTLFGTADGFVVSLAENNGNYSAAFKSMFDWMTRIHREVWKHKPILLMATSPGGRGGATVLELAKGAFPRFGAGTIIDFSLPSFDQNFNENGIIEEELAETLSQKLREFQKEI